MKMTYLGDGERLVEVAERVELPVLPLHRDVELLDTCSCSCTTHSVGSVGVSQSVGVDACACPGGDDTPSPHKTYTHI